MVLWTQLGTVLDVLGIMPTQEASPFLYNLVSVYGLFPAFILSVLTLVSVSLVTRPPSGVEDHFDVFDKPLSAVTSQPGSGTPSYVTDGGRDVSPKAITEADNIRAHVGESGYWNDE